MAYELLTESEQHELQTILTAHPRFDEDFRTPKNIEIPEEIDRWRIGRAGYWPDVARRGPFDRPNWHWQLASTLTIGKVIPPKSPLNWSEKSNLETKDLHIAQAVEMCRTIFRDKSRSNSDRALAICWLVHLVADAHQPCHAGSLYVEDLFPNGDRGANSIPTRQSKNLHSLWDGLLGPKFDAGDVRRRMTSIMIQEINQIWCDATEAPNHESGLDPLTWLAESRKYARSHVYTPEVLAAVESARRGSQKIQMIDLSEKYLEGAGELARIRAAFAANRLAMILRLGVEK